MTAALTPNATSHRPQLRLVPTGDDVVEPFDLTGWAVSAAALLLVVMVALSALALGRGAFWDLAPDRAATAAGATITARPGDTLWSIAHRVKPDQDVRALVDDLVALNGTVIQPGQEIRLPLRP